MYGARFDASNALSNLGMTEETILGPTFWPQSVHLNVLGHDVRYEV